MEARNFQFDFQYKAFIPFTFHVSLLNKMMQTKRHEFSDHLSEDTTMEYLAKEASRAESSLLNVQQQLCECDSDSLDAIESWSPSLSPKDEKSKLQSLSNELNVICLAKSYLDVMRKSGIDGNDVSTVQLIHLESLLKKEILQPLHHVMMSKSKPSDEFRVLYNEISRRHTAIEKRICACAILGVRKTLKQTSYPSPDATKIIVSALELEAFPIDRPTGSESSSDMRINIEALQQIDSKILTKELVKPIVQRVQHHFLTSRTIPQEKLLKIPHLIIAYLRKVIPYAAPILSRTKCEVYFYQEINNLIQHTLFQRGYFEKMVNSNAVVLTLLVQDVMKYDVFIKEMVGKERSLSKDARTIMPLPVIVDMPSLMEQLVCKNSRLFQWWIETQHNHALHILSENEESHDSEAINSTTEIFQSLLHSQRAKLSILKQPRYRSMFLQHLVIPTCMKYLELQHKRAKMVRSKMDNSTIYNLPSNIIQWIMLIEHTSQTVRKLHDFNSPELVSLSESFETFCTALLEDCANSYMNLLMERSTLSSFLMTAGHLLSHGGDSSIQNGMADVCMILNVWNSESISNLVESRTKNVIIEKVGHFLEQQLLEVILDESLQMTKGGCQLFCQFVLEIVQIMNTTTDEKCCCRLHDLTQFMLETEAVRRYIYTLLDKEQDEELQYLEVEQDGTLFTTIDSMIRAKGYEFMSVQDAVSLMQRIV